jgi:hypothetical protein
MGKFADIMGDLFLVRGEYRLFVMPTRTYCCTDDLPQRHQLQNFLRAHRKKNVARSLEGATDFYSTLAQRVAKLQVLP